MEHINTSIRDFLHTSPDDAQLTDFINNLKPDIKPKLRFAEIDHQDIKEPIPVYVHMMVQDIR